MVALHKSDYIGMNLGIRGWGKEDVDLFDRFLGRQDLSVFRSCDPDFVHVYHPVVCDKSLNKDQVEILNVYELRLYMKKYLIINKKLIFLKTSIHICFSLNCFIFLRFDLFFS